MIRNFDILFNARFDLEARLRHGWSWRDASLSAGVRL